MELKATELRIGNLVLNPHTNEESVITAMDISDIENGTKTRLGLAITEYQALKMGFEKKEQGDVNALQVGLVKKIGSCYVGGLIVDGKVEMWCSLMGFCIKDNIKFVHEIQNLEIELGTTY